jgi:hypothetical protein
VARATFKKYVKKAAERAEKRMLADPSSMHAASESCMCLPCLLARYKVLTSSLEDALFEVVSKKVAARRAAT